jgi:LysR family hydrogen peroxide-inducible transcriptional activator
MPLFIKEDFTANLIPALKRGDLDVIIIALPFAEAGLVAQGVYREKFRVVTPAGHPWQGGGPVAPDALSGEHLLLLGQGNCFRDQVLEACPGLMSGDALSHAMEGSSLETVRHMVASGAGVAVMPSTAADPLAVADSPVAVLPFAAPEPERQVGLVWRVTFPRGAAVDVVRTAIQACTLPGTVKI